MYVVKAAETYIRMKNSYVKMLMKLTPDVDYHQHFCAPFLYKGAFCSFSLITVWLCNFSVKEYCSVSGGKT